MKQSVQEIPFLESTCNYSSRQSKGYGGLIRSYVAFLKTKILFHKDHPEFSGNMNYEDYISVKTVTNLNEGYEVVSKLMDFQDEIIVLGGKGIKK